MDRQQSKDGTFYGEVQIVRYEDRYRSDFKRLNTEWISHYFELEEEDIRTFGHPEKVIEGGGQILVALLQDEVVGVCAIKKHTSERYELSKFAVDARKRGFGIGNALMEAVIEQAGLMGVPLLFLEGNTRLGASIHLYRKFGFQEIPMDRYQSEYKRVDIVMERRFY